MPYEAEGRIRQKQRTRNALVVAARQLIADGHTPTVEDAAIAANVSRTTAYRYFPTQTALLAGAHPEIDATTLLPEDPPEDVESRLAEVVKAFTAIILDTEAQQRATLRLALERDASDQLPLPLRQGRAIGWIEDALAPLATSMSAKEIHRLALAIRSTTGIEALVWLTDIAGLSRDEAVELMCWSARALLQSATDWHPPPVTPPRPGRRTRQRRAR